MNPSNLRNASYVLRIAFASLLVFSIVYILDFSFQFNGMASLHGILNKNQEFNFLQFKVNVTLEELSQCQSSSAIKVSNITAELDQTNTDLAYEKEELARVEEISKKLKEKVAMLSRTRKEMEKKSMELSNAKQEATKSEKLISILSSRNNKLKVLNDLRGEEALLKSRSSSMDDYIDRASSNWPKALSWRKDEILSGPPEDGYCHSKHLSAPIPYQWFCHYQKDVFLYDSNGVEQNLTYLGQFSQSKGEHVFHYEIKKPGLYTIKSKNVEISKFWVNPENCSCPEPLNSFKKKFQCSAEIHHNVHSQFGKWLPKSIDEKFFQKKIYFYDSPGALIQVSIINNTIYWRFVNKKNKVLDFNFHFFDLLQSLMRKVRIPDCEFFYNQFLDPQSYHSYSPLVLSGNVDLRRNDVPTPDPHFWNWIKNGEYLKVATAAKPWEEKNSTIHQEFLTGYDVERIQQNPYILLAKEAKKRQNSTDVTLIVPTWVQLPNATMEYLFNERIAKIWWRVDKDRQGKYKYGINHLPEYGYPDLLLGIYSGKLMLIRSNFMKRWWFDFTLQNGVNVIEVGDYYKDLVGAADWIAENDELAKKMANNAFHAVMQKVRPQDAYCWLALGLTQYSKALNFTPKIRPGMVSIDERVPKESCDCVEPW